MAVVLAEGRAAADSEVLVPESEELLTLAEARYWAVEDCIRRALMATRGNVSRAAMHLGIARPTLHGLMKDHSLTSQMFRPSDAAPAEE